MDVLHIAGDSTSPNVQFDPRSGDFELSGKSVLQDADTFYQPIFTWMDEYAKAPAATTTMRFKMEYFNITSSKKMLYILTRLNDIFDAGNSVEVEWHYNGNDQEMRDVGSDFEFMVKVPFYFVPRSQPEASLAS